jgi:uncharacterized protein HemY
VLVSYTALHAEGEIVMTLVGLVIAVVVLCLLLWLVDSIGPADIKIRRIIQVLVVLAVLLYLWRGPVLF